LVAILTDQPKSTEKKANQTPAKGPKAAVSPREATTPSPSERPYRNIIRRDGITTIAGTQSSTVKDNNEQKLGLNY